MSTLTITTPKVWPFPERIVPAAPPRWALPAERIREERTALWPLRATARTLDARGSGAAWRSNPSKWSRRANPAPAPCPPASGHCEAVEPRRWRTLERGKHEYHRRPGGKPA